MIACKKDHIISVEKASEAAYALKAGAGSAEVKTVLGEVFFSMSRFFNRKSIAFVLVALALVAGFIGSFALRSQSHAAGSAVQLSVPPKRKGRQH